MLRLRYKGWMRVFPRQEVFDMGDKSPKNKEKKKKKAIKKITAPIAPLPSSDKLK